MPRVLSLIYYFRYYGLTILVSCIVGFLVFFPFADLSDMATSKISEATNNQAYVQFSQLGLSAWPFGIKVGNLDLDTRGLGTVVVDELTVSPAIGAVFGTPSGSLHAKGIFHGNLDVSLKPAGKSETGNERHRLEVSAETLNLSELKDLSQLPISIEGQMSMAGSALFDLALADQPESEFSIQVEKFEIPSQTINTQMGPINLPDIKLSSLELKGHMANGTMTIDESRFGHDGDELQGTLKGTMSLPFRPSPGGAQIVMGPYNLALEFTMKSAMENRLSLFLALVNQFKTPLGDSSRYRFRLTGQNSMAPASFSALH